MRVYLCGPIAGCTDEEATGWRNKAKTLWPAIDWVDPMDYMDARGVVIDQAVAKVITDADKNAILSCDAVLRNAMRPSEGSAQETMFAWQHGIRVVAFAKDPSPWVMAHSESVWGSLELALLAL